MKTTHLSSNPILRTTLVWGGIVGTAVIIVAAVVGGLVAGSAGAWSGVLGALVGILFPAFTAISILIANRWYGSPSYLQIFFGVVMGAWLVKFIVVIVLLLVLMQIEWIVPIVFYISLVVSAVLALTIDLLVIARARIPAVSDTSLPTVVADD